MRSDAIVRIIGAAAALALLGTGSVAAQQDIEPPPNQIERLRTAVVTSTLDPAPANSIVVDTSLARHQVIRGIDSSETNGWTASGPAPSTDLVTEAVIEEANANRDVIVISGGDSAATLSLANSFQATMFLDVGQSPPCVTLDGRPDPSGTCAGDSSSLPFNYSAIDFAVEDGAYLAGVIAAGAASNRSDRLGIISGTPECATCNRYVRGFINGARSVEPDIDIALAYLADDEVNGFGDATSAETFTRAFIDVHRPDVLLPVGRGASLGMVEAACDAEVLVVGAGIDVAAQRPELADCVLTSVTVDLESAVFDGMNDFANGTTQREVVYDILNEGVEVAFPERFLTLPTTTRTNFDEARTGIITGQVITCSEVCDRPIGFDAEPDAEETATE